MNVVLTFTDWLLRVDMELIRRTGAQATHQDLPDYDWMGAFNEGLDPEYVAHDALAATAESESIAGVHANEVPSNLQQAKAADERVQERMTRITQEERKVPHKHGPESDELPQMPTTKRRGRRPRQP